MENERIDWLQSLKLASFNSQMQSVGYVASANFEDFFLQLHHFISTMSQSFIMSRSASEAHGWAPVWLTERHGSAVIIGCLPLQESLVLNQTITLFMSSSSLIHFLLLIFGFCF